MAIESLTTRPPHVPPERVVDFDVYYSTTADADYGAAWKALQTSGAPDIVWSPRRGGHWIVTRGRLVRELLADQARFSTRFQMVPKLAGEHKTIPNRLDPPEHKPVRALVNTVLSSKAVSKIEPNIRRLAMALTESIRVKGSCNFVHDYADVFPVHIFLEMMDLPTEDARRLKGYADRIVRPDSPDATEKSFNALRDYIKPVIEARRGGKGEDMVSRIVNGRIAGAPVSLEDALLINTNLLMGGLDTVVNLLGFIMLFLARNPEHRRELVDNPALIDNAATELERRFSVVTTAREVREDLVYQGIEMKKGDMVVLPILLDGMDELLHDDAMEVDFHRKRMDPLLFGTGPHMCPGAMLARLEVKITLQEWLARIPNFCLAPGAEIRFTGGAVPSLHNLPLVWDVAGTRSNSDAHLA